MPKMGPLSGEEKQALVDRLQNGRKRGRGKSTKPSRAKAMASMCHNCMYGYIDGKEDCGCVDCPLYSWMPYAEEEPDLKWMEINPKKKAIGTNAKGELVYDSGDVCEEGVEEDDEENED